MRQRRINELFDNPDLLHTLNSSRLTSVEHVGRMGKQRAPLKALICVSRKRPQGQTKTLINIDNIERDVRDLSLD